MIFAALVVVVAAVNCVPYGYGSGGSGGYGGSNHDSYGNHGSTGHGSFGDSDLKRQHRPTQTDLNDFNRGMYF